jgi:hypothetical protein
LFLYLKTVEVPFSVQPEIFFVYIRLRELIHEPKNSCAGDRYDRREQKDVSPSPVHLMLKPYQTIRFNAINAIGWKYDVAAHTMDRTAMPRHSLASFGHKKLLVLADRARSL